MSEFYDDPLNAYPGLTEDEVAVRTKNGDVNVVVFRSSRTYKEIIQENVLTLFHISFGIILGLLAILGQYTDALFSGITILSNIVVGVFQEVKAKLALDQLALLSVQQVTVRRDGVSLIVPLQEIVRDDLIELKPGDRAAVDGDVIFSQFLEMDESLLTGESDSMPKQLTDQVLSGSFCLAGSGLFRAVKIGNESYAAQLSQTSRTYKRSLTPLQQKINAVVEIFVLALLIAGILYLASSLNNGRDAVNTLRYASVIINSFVPAGLVLSISVALALGAVEISRQQTLIQRINAIDSMNSVRVLCTDKTGTLTQNKLLVQEILCLDQSDSRSLRELMALYVTLISNQNSSAKAIAMFVGLPKTKVHKIDEIPFSSGQKWGAIALDHGTSILVGSPEILLTEASHKLTAQQYASQGIRVLALVTTEQPMETWGTKTLPIDRSDRGLILLKDELRPGVVETMTSLQDQGIEVKVISGDSVDTVAAIAAQAGIVVSPETMFTQKDLDQLTPAKFSNAAVRGQVFGRITPETKRRLIGAMVRRGAYVAMVGDGVNDVPAFKEAQLAIAMNDGAQICKDVADIVLLNNSLATLPQAFTAGDDIKQKILTTAVLYLTKNMMVILTISFVGFIQLPFPIEPRQLTLLTFFILGVPTILIALGVLKTKKIHNFLKDVLGYSLIAGLIGALAMTSGYVMSYFGGLGIIGLELELPIAEQVFQELGRGQAQAVAVIIGLFYCLLIFWDASNISIWRPRSLWISARSRQATRLGIAMIAIAITLLIAFPDLFQIEIPDRLGWSLALFLPFTANYLLRVIQCSSLLRHVPRFLTQP